MANVTYVALIFLFNFHIQRNTFISGQPVNFFRYDYDVDLNPREEYNDFVDKSWNPRGVELIIEEKYDPNEDSYKILQQQTSDFTDEDSVESLESTQDSQNEILGKNILRGMWKGCAKSARKSCTKACKSAMRSACRDYSCKRGMKRTFKRECKDNCKSMFRNPE